MSYKKPPFFLLRGPGITVVIITVIVALGCLFSGYGFDAAWNALELGFILLCFVQWITEDYR